MNGLRHAISEKTANNQRSDQESDDWKICRVCQDRATGYHFNAMTCEGCKVMWLLNYIFWKFGLEMTPVWMTRSKFAQAQIVRYNWICFWQNDKNAQSPPFNPVRLFLDFEQRKLTWSIYLIGSILPYGRVSFFLFSPIHPKLGSRRWNWKFREKAGYRNSVTFKL